MTSRVRTLQLATQGGGPILQVAFLQAVGRLVRTADYWAVAQLYVFPSLTSPQARFAFGLTFRLDDEGNALGFSLSRGVPGSESGCDNDGIPFELSGYTNFTPFLVFWMKQYAKKEIGPTAL